jgi:MerR family transcriptional regulator/heat shock protein HspR
MADEPAQTPLYSIAVAAELAGLTPATLRLYEEKKLITPARTSGGTRRYSDADVARARTVAQLQTEGINLLSAGRVMRLEEENSALRQQLEGQEDRPRGGRKTG